MNKIFSHVCVEGARAGSVLRSWCELVVFVWDSRPYPEQRHTEWYTYCVKRCDAPPSGMIFHSSCCLEFIFVLSTEISCKDIFYIIVLSAEQSKSTLNSSIPHWRDACLSLTASLTIKDGAAVSRGGHQIYFLNISNKIFLKPNVVSWSLTTI